jgi:hypothetical protein
VFPAVLIVTEGTLEKTRATDEGSTGRERPVVGFTLPAVEW